MPLYLSEADVEALLTPAQTVPAIEESFRRLAAGGVVNVPRRRVPLENGSFALMAATDPALGYAGVKSYTVVEGKAVFVVCLFDLEDGRLAGVVEADSLGQRRTGAATAVAARYLARPGASSLGVIGCGRQAAAQVDAIRATVPTIDRVVAYCRTPEKLTAFCREVGAQPAENHREAGSQDVVVTVTTSADPVLRGEWLVEGAFVAAVGANDPRKRELDDVVLERTTFVCCDSIEQARLESGDLIEPIQNGVLDWLEVHELQEVVAGEARGRQTDGDIVLFKSNGIAAWDVAAGVEVLRRARERGVGREL